MKKMNLCTLRRYSPFVLAIVLVFLQTACLGLIDLRKNSRLSQNILPQNNKKVYAEEFVLKPDTNTVPKEINELLLANKFDEIEKIASQAREKKERLAGAYWKLDSVYKGLTNIYAEYPGQEITDEMWKNRIELLNGWKQSFPESITARVALAKAYLEYGGYARGTGYINTVSKENYQLFHERVGLALDELKEAKQLKEKCPGWYRELLYIAMVDGASSDEFNQIFDEAINFEPNYLQFYLVKSESVTPKWNGKPGEWQKFVDALPSKLATLKTDETDIIYFTVVVNKINDQSLNLNYAMLAKERIKKGFADIEKKYKADNLRLNQYAFISSLTLDFASAQMAFERIGGDFNKAVWGEQTFTEMKKMASQSGNLVK
jgi:hypothetical protein